MKSWLRGILICLTIAMMFSSCSESITNPDTPGSGLLVHDVLIADTVLYATNDTTFMERIPPDAFVFLSPLAQNLVGKDANYTALAVLRFAVGAARDTIRVLSAKVTLRAIGWQGETGGQLGFDAHPIRAAWTEDTLKWDQVSASSFFSDTTIGEYLGTVTADSEFISFNLDTAKVREWYTSGTTSNNGILLVPKPTSRIIRPFQAFSTSPDSSQPVLEVIAQGVNSTTPDTTRIQIGSDTYVANVDPFPVNPERIMTQAGIVYRSKITFEVSHLPKNAIINLADMMLERDPALTKVSRFSPSAQPIVHALLGTDSTNYQSAYAAGTLVGAGNTFTFDVRSQVQLWLSGTNYGLILRQPTINEYSTLDLLTFYGSRVADTILRPRIKIKYTIFQN